MCAGEESASVLVTVRPAQAELWPEHLLVTYWGTQPEDRRVPRTGSLSTADKRASVFITMNPTYQGSRRLLIRGMRGNEVVSLGAARLSLVDGRSAVTVTLQARLPDSDADGLPDEIDDDCGGPGCRPALDATIALEPDASTRDSAPPDARGSDVPPESAPSPPDASNIDLETGLVAAWKLDLGSGLLLHDGSGQGNDCTLRKNTGADWTSGVRGKALQLTMSNWATCPTSPSFDTITRQITIAAWTWRETKSYTYEAAVSRQQSTGTTNAFWLGVRADSVFRMAVGSNITEKGVTIPEKRWVHLAGTYDGRIMRLYVDGQEVETLSFTNASFAPGRNVAIGADNNTADPNAAEHIYSGRLDEVMLYSRALTPEEIRALAR